MTKFSDARPLASASFASSVDPARFREAMSRVGAAVHIVATDGPAGLAGITATAMTSITIDPPMVLFCVAKKSPSARRIIENGVFCVNTLAAPDEALADVFAGRTRQHLGNRFTSGEWTKLATGAPVLTNAVAAFDCRLVEVKEVSTHLIVIGAVEAVQYGPEQPGLAYIHRKYSKL